MVLIPVHRKVFGLIFFSLLTQSFSDAEKYLVDSALVFPSAEPVVAYLDSLQHFYNPYLPKELTWRTLMEQLECQIKERLAGAGSYRVPKTTGVFIARRELGLGK